MEWGFNSSGEGKKSPTENPILVKKILPKFKEKYVFFFLEKENPKKNLSSADP